MFTPNDTVIVPGLAKPLPQTGTWGAQTRFPNGLPKPCLLAAVPCVRVVYNVPEAKVTCEWLLGYLVAAEPQPDGTIKHALHKVVLDENADAARYTLRKSWSSGEHSPKPVDEHAPVYPVAAQSAGIDGVVVVRIVIGPDGSVVSASGISGPKMLQGPAIDAVRQWKFDPPRVGSQSTSYRLDEYFSYNRGRPVYGNGDSSGRIVIPNADPHYAPGYKSVTTSGTEWETCSAVNCTNAAPPVPK
jgi:TonB family protein